jgi:ABC-type polysaccharide/polyol phosphate export permease
MRETIHSALSDFGRGMRLRGVWIALAAEDIGDQHRRTALGPLWMLVNYLAFAATFIFVFHGTAQTPTYPAYVATGLLVWFYIMEVVSQGVSLFRREESFIRGTPLPLSVYVLRLWAQSTIRGAYALAGCLAILLLSATPFTTGWGFALIGLGVVLAVAPAAITVCAFLGAYCPDSQFIVTNLMRLGMFLTPVFWMPGGEATIQTAFRDWNPFTYFLEIVRLPVLTGKIPAEPLLIATAIGALLWIVALLLLGRYRRHVAFVL